MSSAAPTMPAPRVFSDSSSQVSTPVLKRASDAEAVRWIADPTIVIIPARRPDIFRIVTPRPGADHVKEAVVGVDPGRSIGDGTLIVLVPTIRHPLGNPSAHVVEAERIGLDVFEFRRRPSILVTIASLAVDHARRVAVFVGRQIGTGLGGHALVPRANRDG